jgi:hypothetical protein
VILFLDYDGVLHPDAAYYMKGQPVLQASGELFMWAPILVELLQPYPDLQIVLSTSWVRVLRFNRARDYLPAELKKRVIGGTWHTAMQRHPEGTHRLQTDWYSTASRYEQIARYVDRAGDRAIDWLAIDDDIRDWSEAASDRLVATDGHLGLSSPLTQQELRDKLQQLELVSKRRLVAA